MIPINIKSLFELRKTLFLSNQDKKVSGRCFKHNGKFGVYDATGIIWPIQIEDHKVSIDEGDYIIFSAKVDFLSSINTLKYKDHDFIIKVKHIFTVTSCVDNSMDSFIFERSKILPKLDIEKGTLFWENNKDSSLIKSRSFCINRMKRFFKCYGFIEMETPTLVPIGGMENYLTSFTTVYVDHKGKSHKLELPTSPELALKKILSKGYPKIFQFAKSYRNNGEVSQWHEPEFLMLEWYEVGGDLERVMKMTKCLVESLAASIGIDLATENPHWPVKSVSDLMKEHAGFALEEVQELSVFRSKASLVSKSYQPDDDWDTLFSKVFMDCIEPWLNTQRFCFVFNFPAQMPGLSKTEGIFSKRVELYSHGVEISNGYEELTDWKQYANRGAVALNQKATELYPDLVFIKSMQFGIPECCGNALGVDRLIAVLLGIPDIKSFLPVPFLSQFSKGSVAEK